MGTHKSTVFSFIKNKLSLTAIDFNFSHNVNIHITIFFNINGDEQKFNKSF